MALGNNPSQTDVIKAIRDLESSGGGGVQSVTTGSTNGTLSVDGTDVAVYGLGSNAFNSTTIPSTTDNVTSGSTSALTSGGAYTALDNKMDKSNPTGTGSFSLNRKANTTIGSYSHAEGYDTTASSYYSHAEGYKTVASGIPSHAEGSETTASGNWAHAEGWDTTASNSVAHAEGYSTTASGAYSHSEGSSTTASGTSSHAQGGGTQAIGNYSDASGYYTTANRKSQHVFGEANEADTGGTDATTRGNYVEIVGNGTIVGNTVTPSNARTLDWDGNETLAGNIIVKGGKIGDGNNANYKLALPNTSSFTADKTLATTDQIPSIPVTDVQLNGSSVVSSGVANIKALPNYSLNIGSTNGGNPRQVKFLSVNYTNYDGNNACFIKLGAMCSHGNGASYIFMDDIFIGVSSAGSVTCDVYKYFQQEVTLDGVTRNYGDVFYTIDTTNKVVDFYILLGQYSTANFTPYTKIGATTTTGITQLSGTPTYYSSGTKVWSNGNSTTYARKTDIPTVPSAGTTASAVGTTASGGSASTYSKSDHVHNISGSTITGALGYTPWHTMSLGGSSGYGTFSTGQAIIKSFTADATHDRIISFCVNTYSSGSHAADIYVQVGNTSYGGRTISISAATPSSSSLNAQMQMSTNSRHTCKTLVFCIPKGTTADVKGIGTTSLAYNYYYTSISIS